MYKHGPAEELLGVIFSLSVGPAAACCPENHTWIFEGAVRSLDSSATRRTGVRGAQVAALCSVQGIGTAGHSQPQPETTCQGRNSTVMCEKHITRIVRGELSGQPCYARGPPSLVV